MLLHGIFPPITTPFYPDGGVYFKKLEHNVERYSKTPVAGIVVLGSTGEAIMLSDEERREVLKTARAATANHKVLVAGTGIESAVETLKLTEYSAALGYDVAMRSEEHTSELQSPCNLVCRLLLEKKKSIDRRACREKIAIPSRLVCAAREGLDRVLVATRLRDQRRVPRVLGCHEHAAIVHRVDS